MSGECVTIVCSMLCFLQIEVQNNLHYGGVRVCAQLPYRKNVLSFVATGSSKMRCVKKEKEMNQNTCHMFAKSTWKIVPSFAKHLYVHVHVQFLFFLLRENVLFPF